MKTRITKLFGIEYPIIQGAMQWLSKPRLAAAVSNAGGLGTINMTTYESPEAFQADIQKMKRLTDKPFSVNLSLLPDTKPDGPIKGFLEAIVSEKVKIVETAGSSPKPFMDTLKGAGCIVMHKIPDSRFAHTAQEVGCDAVCIVGYEGGGHLGKAGVFLHLEAPSLVLGQVPVEVVELVHGHSVEHVLDVLCFLSFSALRSPIQCK